MASRETLDEVKADDRIRLRRVGVETARFELEACGLFLDRRSESGIAKVGGLE